MIIRFEPDPPVNSEQGPIVVEIEIETYDAPTHTATAQSVYLIVGTLRVPCRVVPQTPAGARPPFES